MSSTSTMVLTMFSSTILCSIMPRFIISMRELYDRDLRRRWQGIDTAFGILSQPIASEGAVISAIVFADATQEQEQSQLGLGDEDDLEIEVLGDSKPHVVEGDDEDGSETIRLGARAECWV